MECANKGKKSAFHGHQSICTARIFLLINVSSGTCCADPFIDPVEDDMPVSNNGYALIIFFDFLYLQFIKMEKSKT